MSWVFLTAAILTEVAATVALRASDGLRRRRWVLPVVLGWALAFVFLSFALRHGMAVGVAYGTWAAAGIALTAVAGRLLFGEPLTPTMALGLAMIAAGVGAVEVGAAGVH